MHFFNVNIISVQEGLNIARQGVEQLSKEKRVMMNVKLENTNIIGVRLEKVGIIVRVLLVK